MYFTEWLLVFVMAIAINTIRKQTVSNGADVADAPEASDVPAPEIQDFDASHFTRNSGYATQIGSFAL
jgi:hypothetical protein